MKEESQLAPEPVQRAIIALDTVVSKLASVLRGAQVGHYESDLMAKEYLTLIVRNVEAILVLAHSHWVLYPAAMNMARSAFETALRTLWLLNPDTPMDREARWLAFLQEEENHYDFMAKQLKDLGQAETSSEYAQRRDLCRGFRQGVTEKLPPQVVRIDKLPTFSKMVKALREERKYLVYSIASQYTHGTAVATSLYHRGYGTELQIREDITAADWQGCLQLCFYSLFGPGLKFAERQGVHQDVFLSDAEGAAVQSAIHAISAPTP